MQDCSPCAGRQGESRNFARIERQETASGVARKAKARFEGLL
jgi:hypothetical protein